MFKIQFDVNIANGVAIDVAHDALPDYLMEAYPFLVKQSHLCYMLKLND